MKRMNFLSSRKETIVFSLFRIASPLSIDMYAWTKEQSTRDNGYLLGALGCMSVVVLIVTKILAKR